MLDIAKMESESVVEDTSTLFQTLKNAVHVLNSVLNSFVSSLANLPLRQFIRLCWIIGGYVLIRPYLELGFRKLFATTEDQCSETTPTTATVPTITASSQEMDPADGATNNPKARDINVGSTAVRTGWGAAARKRQATILQAREVEEMTLAEELDLDGIDADFLED